MFNHPGARNAGPMGPGMSPGLGGTTTPKPMGAPATPGVRPMPMSRPLGGAPHTMAPMMNQRQMLSTGMERQRMLANTLRGTGGANGVMPAPHPMVNHAMGLPGIK